MSKKETSKTTKKVFCVCKSAFQDKRYGRGKRLANQTMKDNKTAYRCTVCGAMK